MISLVCPSRHRPASMERFVTHALETATNPVEVVFVLDDDDPESHDKASKLGCSLSVVPRQALSNYWNLGAQVASGDILGIMADDIVFRTAGWDELVQGEFERYPDRIVFVFGRDGLHDEQLGTHGFLHRRWIEAVGHFTVPDFSCDYVDTWIDDVASRIDRRSYLPTLYTEHLHPSNGKAQIDDLHRERMANGARDNVVARFMSTQGERIREAEKLREAIRCAS